MDIIQIRASVRAAFSDGRLSAGERQHLRTAGLSSSQLDTLVTNARDGGKLTTGELMAIVNSRNTTVPARSSAQARQGAATVQPRTIAGQTRHPAGPSRADGQPRQAPQQLARASAAAPATHAAAASGGGRGTYRVTANSVYLRTHTGNGLVRGELQRGDTFEVYRMSKGLAWGYAPRLKMHGWMRIASRADSGRGETRRNLVRTDRSPDRRHERAARQYNEGIDYVRPADVRKYGLSGYTYAGVARDPSNAKVYRNVVRGAGVGEHDVDFAARPRVGIRYSFDDDHYVVLVKDRLGNSRWGFMRKADVVATPDANYARWLRDRGVQP